MAKQSHLQAILSAVDRISPVLRKVNLQAGVMRKTFADVGSSARGVLGGLGLPSAVSLGAIGFGLVSMAKNALAYAGALQDAKDVTGMSGRAIQEYGTVFEDAGIAQEEFIAITSKLNKSLAEAAAGKDKSLAGLLTKLRIPIRNLRGEIRSVDELLPELADAFEKNTNPALRARMATELFGKTGAKLIAILMKGGKSLIEARREVQRLGAVLSDADTETLDNLGDAFGLLGRQVRVQTSAAFAKAAPAIMAATKGLQEWIGKNQEVLQQRLGAYIERVATAFQTWVESGGIERLADGIGRLVEGVGEFVRAMGGMRNVLIGLGVLLLTGPVASLFALGASLARLAIFASGPALVAFKLLVGGLGSLFAVLQAGQVVVFGMSVSLGSLMLAALPIIAVIAAVAGAAYLIYRNWDRVGPFLGGVWESVKRAAVIAWNVLRFLFSWSPLGMLVNNWGAITAYAGQLWDEVAGVFRAGFTLLGALLLQWTPLRLVREAWDPVVSFLSETWDRIGTIVGPILSGIRGAAGAVGSFLDNNFGAAASQTDFGPRLSGPGPLAQAGALQSPAARMQGEMRVRFENAPAGMRVEPGPATSPGLAMNVDVGRRSTGSIG